MRIVAIIAHIMTEREFGWLVVGVFIGIGIMHTPALNFLAKPGKWTAIWGAYLILLENPKREYFRRKGKPTGLLLPPYHFTNPLVKKIISNGKNSKNNTESNLDNLEEKIDGSEQENLDKKPDQEIKYAAPAAFPSQQS